MRAKFRLILVDEFQDVDPAQFELLRLLAPPESRPRLVVVGDPDQSIYGFRGTVPRLLSVDFAAVYGGETRAPRRVPALLAGGARRRRAAARGDAARPRPARCCDARDLEPAPPAVVVARESDAVDEAFFCAREIKRLLATSPTLRLGDFAILLRSTTALGAPFEEALRALGLPLRGPGLGRRPRATRWSASWSATSSRCAGPTTRTHSRRRWPRAWAGSAARTLSRLRAHAYERGRPLTPRRCAGSCTSLAARDPQRYPLPWGGDAADRGAARRPTYFEFLTEDELDSLHARDGRAPAPAAAARERLPLAASRTRSSSRTARIGAPARSRAAAGAAGRGDRRPARARSRASRRSRTCSRAPARRASRCWPTSPGSLEALLAAAADDTEAAPARTRRGPGHDRAPGQGPRVRGRLLRRLRARAVSRWRRARIRCSTPTTAPGSSASRSASCRRGRPTRTATSPRRRASPTSR